VFLGFVVSRSRIHDDESKVKAIEDWSIFENVRLVRSFCGFADFYRRFVRDLSTIVAPLNELTKKRCFLPMGCATRESFLRNEEKII